MPIAVVCPACSARLNAPDAAAGKTVKCPKCQSAMVIPAPAPAGGFEVVDEPAPTRYFIGSLSNSKPGPPPPDQVSMFFDSFELLK